MSYEVVFFFTNQILHGVFFFFCKLYIILKTIVQNANDASPVRT